MIEALADDSNVVSPGGKFNNGGRLAGSRAMGHDMISPWIHSDFEHDPDDAIVPLGDESWV
jgi:hypothetical protein